MVPRCASARSFARIAPRARSSGETRARPRRGRGASTRASKDDDARGGGDDSFAYGDARVWALCKDVAGSTPREAWFAPAQVGVAVVLAGVVDAGYSGDWSRIGAITTAQEGAIRAFCVFVAVAHGALGVVAYDIARRRNVMDPRWAFVKTFVVGTLALVEVAFGGGTRRRSSEAAARRARETRESERESDADANCD